LIKIYNQLENLKHKSHQQEEKVKVQTVLNQTMKVLDAVAPQVDPEKKKPIYKRVSEALKLFKEQNPTFYKILICLLLGLTLPIVMPTVGALALF
jgi:hypothetical protein